MPDQQVPYSDTNHNNRLKEQTGLGHDTILKNIDYEKI